MDPAKALHGSRCGTLDTTAVQRALHCRKDLPCLPQVATVVRADHQQPRPYRPWQQSQKWVAEADAIQVKIARLLHQASRPIMRRYERLEHRATVQVQRRHDFFLGLEFPFWRRLKFTNKPASKPSRLDQVFPRPLCRREFTGRLAERRSIQSVGLCEMVKALTYTPASPATGLPIELLIAEGIDELTGFLVCAVKIAQYSLQVRGEVLERITICGHAALTQLYFRTGHSRKQRCRPWVDPSTKDQLQSRQSWLIANVSAP